MQRKSFDTLAGHLQEVMVDSLPTMVEKHVKEQKNKEEMEKMIAKAILQEHDPQLQQQDIAIWIALQMKFGILQTSEYEAYVSGESSFRHDNEKEQGPTTSGHEHKFITYIVAKRANECIVSITEPNFKNLNKNDIEDMYLLIMNRKVPDYAETGLLWSLSVYIRSSAIWERVHDFQLRIESYQQKVNLTAPTISFPIIEKHKMFSIIYEPMHGIIYKNSMKEKRVMRHSEIHKFCDATLNRVLECLKSYNNDVKYGYIQKDLTKDEVEYLKLFEEEIEVSQADEKMGDVCEWKTTWTTKRTPRIIDP
nr:hypothetical protein [Tanacetum cinerariifolium]